MRLVKDGNPGAHAVRVVCVGSNHQSVDAVRRWPRGSMFPLAEGYADLDGKAFHAYYCDDCVAADPTLCAAVIRLCAWCKRLLGFKEPLCDECLKYWGKRKGEHT